MFSHNDATVKRKVAGLEQLVTASACDEFSSDSSKSACSYSYIPAAGVPTTPGAAQKVVAQTGMRAIPQFVIDGEWVQPYRPGRVFLYDEMRKRLGIESEAND
jgi:hypothetical protein